jgi:drug/metabolite transporter (DMT)-like permease
MKIRIWLGLFTLYVIWGSTYLAISFAIDSIPPYLMAAVRFLIAGTILLVWRILAGDPKPTKRQILWAGIVGLFLIVGGNGSVTWAEQRIASGIAALMIGTEPLWLVLLDALNPKKPKPGWLSLVGVSIGFIGVIFLVSPSFRSGGAHDIDLIGALVGILAALLWSIGSIIARDKELPKSATLSTGIEMLVGSVVLFIFGTLSGEWARLDVSAITWKSLAGVGYLIVFGSLVAFTVYLWLLRSAPTPLVATYAYVTPLVAIFLGYFLAQEPLSYRILVSALLIVSSVVMINTSKQRKDITQMQPSITYSSGDD